ncbi:terpene synthase family protein [Streptomyces sp. BE20]|uniref:terpene synthase family protein n=1 Tax=Streptomyces sp. BE20 TaxID=3002525 RepID=UPI002E78B661|nr:terpene synthase family protein [Streptomyces sp. BE20]MEE1821305.1 terpene synthase family protein [Streptomyces sp. BE20]
MPLPEYGASPAMAVVAYTAELIAVSLGERAPRSVAAHAMVDVLSDLGAGRSPAWRRLLAEENVRWIERYPIEIRASRAGRLMPLHDYLVHRRYSVGELNFLYFVEYVRDIDLPTPVRFLPAMRRARNLAAEWVGIYNDVCSFEKERALGYPHNAVLMAQKWLGCGADKAADVVNTLADGLLDQFEAALAAVPGQLRMLPGNTRQAAEDVARVVEGYRHLVRGNWDYPLTTPRYVDTADYIPGSGVTDRRPDWTLTAALRTRPV